MLLVTVICYVSDVPPLLREICRVLRIGGQLIVGFIYRQSFLGRLYESRRASDQSYRSATFYTVAEVAALAQQAGFGEPQFRQTLFAVPTDSSGIQPTRAGFGQGAFVVMQAQKSNGHG